ncbi:MAG: hypothetical protein FRX49_06937 [Trebouxia sp. A1-2]|nr:MAG: hypothetical protein FRX49_06937 [Trebouxia sp. A1-2]
MFEQQGGATFHDHFRLQHGSAVTIEAATPSTSKTTSTSLNSTTAAAPKAPTASPALTGDLPFDASEIRRASLIDFLLASKVNEDDV